LRGNNSQWSNASHQCPGVRDGGSDPSAGMRLIWGYVLTLVIDTMIVAAVPWLSIGFLK
jgi:hypothetical protein